MTGARRALLIYLVHLSMGHFPSDCENGDLCLQEARRAFPGYQGAHGAHGGEKGS